MPARALLIAFALVSAGGVHAAEGFQLNGRTLGAPLEEVSNHPDYECGGVSGCFLYTTCSLLLPGEERLADVPLDVLVLHYTGERLTAIQVEFPSEAFDRAADALVQQYGGPSRAHARSDSTGNQIWLWQDGRQLLRLERYFRGSGSASLIIADQGFLSELVE